jgi:hypothetical protein
MVAEAGMLNVPLTEEVVPVQTCSPASSKSPSELKNPNGITFFKLSLPKMEL